MRSRRPDIFLAPVQVDSGESPGHGIVAIMGISILQVGNKKARLTGHATENR